MLQLHTTGVSSIHDVYADISVNKSRIKKLANGCIYLADGTEFEIELTNKSIYSYLAKIEMNEVSISSSGFVLYPGQHVYLERYLDTNERFRFGTYDVEDTSDNREAIRNNGAVTINFYREFIPLAPKVIRRHHSPVIYEDVYDDYWWPRYPAYPRPHYTPYYDIKYFTDGPTYDSSVNNAGDSILSLSVGSFSEPTQTGAQTDAKVASQPDSGSWEQVSAALETGRVEKGSESEQELTTVHKDFEDTIAKTITFKLFPLSSQPQTAHHNVPIYCATPGCSRRQKRGETFCATCGQKY